MTTRSGLSFHDDVTPGTVPLPPPAAPAAVRPGHGGPVGRGICCPSCTSICRPPSSACLVVFALPFCGLSCFRWHRPTAPHCARFGLSTIRPCVCPPSRLRTSMRGSTWRRPSSPPEPCRSRTRASRRPWCWAACRSPSSGDSHRGCAPWGGLQCCTSC